MAKRWQSYKKKPKYLLTACGCGRIMSFGAGIFVTVNLPASIDYWQERWASKDKVKPNE